MEQPPVPQLNLVSPFATPVSSPFSTPQKSQRTQSRQDADNVGVDLQGRVSPRSALLTNQDDFYQFVDDSLLNSLETNAKQSALNLTALVGHLRTQLQHLSSLSVQYMKLHKMSVENSDAEIEESIASLRALIVKTETLNDGLKAVKPLHDNIKQCRRLLEQLDAAASARLLKPDPQKK
eukprot:TRINITY_DN1762_c0_g1_i1.p1 TRINITY_DN1762_c0_g1~~TRINITY_DN1762_c0_g1_i1.p1  ORF type:complete len:179 (-),score=27.15 TRINITY_DN1762_c0_g1_i1:378-914(-)